MVLDAELVAVDRGAGGGGAGTAGGGGGGRDGDDDGAAGADAGSGGGAGGMRLRAFQELSTRARSTITSDQACAWSAQGWRPAIGPLRCADASPAALSRTLNRALSRAVLFRSDLRRCSRLGLEAPGKCRP